MKKYRILLFFSALLLVAVSCGKQALQDLGTRLDGLELRASRLEERCKRLNSNIATLQGLAEISQEYDRIASLEEVVEDGVVTGYKVHFVFHSPLTLHLGRNGLDGKDGVDGTPGKDGDPGKDGVVPVVGVETVAGVRYWTLDGQPLLDKDGNRIPLVVTGGSVKDGITPRLKIDGGKWYYSIDEGLTWTLYDIDVQYGDGNIFTEVRREGDEVVFSLRSGEPFRIPVRKSLSIGLNPSQRLEVNATAVLSYAVEAEGSVEVSAFAEGQWRAVVESPSAQSGNITVTAGPSGSRALLTVIATMADGQSAYAVIECVAL